MYASILRRSYLARALATVALAGSLFAAAPVMTQPASASTGDQYSVKCTTYTNLAAQYQTMANQATNPKDKAFYQNLANQHRELSNQYC